MHPYKFFNEVQFTDFDCWMGGVDVTEDVKHDMKQLHPSQFIMSKVKFPLFEISYSYMTNRGNYKEHKKYMVANEEEESLMWVQMQFESWVDNFNRENPHRRISNVQILEIRPYANTVLTIG